MATSSSCKSSGLSMTYLILVLSLAQYALLSAAGLPIIVQPVKSDGSLSLLAIGDWGRNGDYNQTLVANQMANIGEELDIDFVISTGDNFYENGLKDVHDKAFEESFANIYTGNSLQKKWYTVLGNHDYRGDIFAQLSLDLREIDSRWTCIRSFILDAEYVQFFFVDTTPFVLKYWDEPEDDHYDWRDVAPRGPYINNLLKDLDSALKESKATWKFVVGHHTIRSVSDHGDTQELVQLLLPILKENGVDLYINGHDHCLQHISSRDSPIQFLTSGGGSKAWRGAYIPNSDKLQFFYDGQGFMSLELSKFDAKATFYDLFGNILHSWSTSKDPSPFI